MESREPTKDYSILLGGIGGDCHCVGLTILRHSLVTHNYNVHYLGTQNRLEDFFNLCAFFNVVMISSMDGHSRYYLAEFPSLWTRCGSDRPLWYLGGNLGLGDPVAHVKYFREMHFDRVFPKFADIDTVLALLHQDLAQAIPKPGPNEISKKIGRLVAPSWGELSENRLSFEQFDHTRKEVLDQWKTGSAARELVKNAEFLHDRPSFPRTQARANQGAISMLVQPRSGVGSIDEQVKIFRNFKHHGIHVASYQVDSLTRLNEYDKVEQAIKDGNRTGMWALNGFPVVNYGVAGLRKIMLSVGLPLQTRHSTRDPRLLAEISYAGGVTAFEGGCISYNIPYYKDYPLAESIPRWQYVDFLTGMYYENFGIVLDREFFGTLTGTLIPPCLAIVVGLLESLLAVLQGVKCVSLGYAEQGNRVQDIAAMWTMRAMAQKLLHSLGHKDIQVNTVFHQYMAAFPNNRSLAENLIYNSAVTAALSQATRVIIKTPVEAFGIPSAEDNVQAIDLVRSGIVKAQSVTLDQAAIADECDLIRRETQDLFDSVVVAGCGEVARGIVVAFLKGYLDIPFSPSVHNRGAVITVRDVNGAVRFLSTGNLQLDSEVRDFHRFKVDERRRSEGILRRQHDYQLVEKDVMQVARGQYPAWPLAPFPPEGSQRLCCVGTRATKLL